VAFQCHVGDWSPAFDEFHCLIRHRTLDMIDDERVDGPAPGFELKT
jgi:hypothetical protein